MFKLDLAPLGAVRAARAFERFFGLAAPSGLAGLTTLTPGDFAAVKRQLRFAPAADTEDLLARLKAEASWRQEGERIGF